jgi:type I restriction enzyme S subunit
LERIREEKKRLVKEGKLKKKDLEETPISEDEKPFEIPESWEWVRVKEVFSINPKVVADDNADAAFIPMEKIKACYGSRFSYEIKKWKTIKSSFTCFADGDVAFAKITPCFQNRKSMILKNLPNGIGAGTTELKVLRQYAETIVREYLLYFLASSYFIDEATFKGTANQQRIIVGYLENKLFPLPPLAEQKRIVAKIEELLPKVEAYGKAQESLDKLNEELPERLKKSILQEAITGRLVPQDPNDEPASVLLDKIRAEKEQLVKEGKLKKKDLEETPISEDEIPFEIPESWEWCRLEDVVEFINGRAYKKDELLDKGKYKVLRVGNFFTNDSWYYSDLELPDDKYCYRGDLLYAWSASFGPKIWDGEKTIFHYHIWNVKYSNTVLWREYLYYFFLADKLKIKQATTGSTMIHVSMENMKPRLIPLPPLAEQHRIVEKIEQLLGEIDKLKF